MYVDLLQQLDTETISFNQTGTRLLGLFMVFVMYGVALGLKPHFFRSVLNRPRSLFIGLVCQWVVLPFFTFLLCAVLHNILSATVPS
jgi:BASS family bile acid:Na+ symporter